LRYWTMSFANFWRNPSSEGQLETAKIEIAFENFSLLTWAGRPLELGHLKNLCIFPPPFIFHSQGSAFLTLPPFECAFEPSTIKGSAFPTLPPFECAFEPSPYFFSSAPSSPRPSKVVHFISYLLLSVPSSPPLISFRVRLRALNHQR